MGEWSIKRYDAAMKPLWNEIVKTSRNGTFLIDRNYMDYHSDRFDDFSLIAFRDQKPMALLPANMTEDRVLHSHQGLTYGGWILPVRHFDMADFMQMWRCWLRFMKENGIEEVDYKPMPDIYSLYSSQEDLYALFRSNANVSEVNVSMSLQPQCNPGFNTLQRRLLKKSVKCDVVVREITEESEIMKFHDLLSACLDTRHGVRPVHSFTELLGLRKAFPENIRFFVTEAQGKMSGGICVYDTGIVAHAQYIATTQEGREHGALTSIVNMLVNDVYADRRYFDFGTCNEEGGRWLNEGLARQKGSFGATPVVYSRYNFSVEEALAVF